MSLKHFLSKQYKIKPLYFVGAMLALWGGTQVYQGLANSFMLAHTYYYTTARFFLQSWFPGITFPIFLAIGISGALFIMFIHYKFIMWPIVSFSVQQAYKHDNPIKTGQDKILKRLDELEKLIRDKESQ